MTTAAAPESRVTALAARWTGDRRWAGRWVARGRDLASGAKFGRLNASGLAPHAMSPVARCVM